MGIAVMLAGRSSRSVWGIGDGSCDKEGVRGCAARSGGSVTALIELMAQDHLDFKGDAVLRSEAKDKIKRDRAEIAAGRGVDARSDKADRNIMGFVDSPEECPIAIRLTPHTAMASRTKHAKPIRVAI